MPGPLPTQVGNLRNSRLGSLRYLSAELGRSARRALGPPLIASLFIAARVSAAVYIVDQVAPGASDRNDGTEAKPFQTVQHAADLAQAGDTVFVMAGRYDERVRVKTSGRDGQLITFRAMPRRMAAIHGFDLQASYVRVEGFEITSPTPGVAVQLGASSCEITDCYIHHMSVAVAGTVGVPNADRSVREYSAVSNNRISYNKVYHCQYGFMLGGNGWLVENNEVARLYMYSPGKKYDDCDYSRFFGRGCVERYNYFHGSTAAEIRVAHVDCLQTFTVNGEIAHDLVFEDNTCFDFHQMCMVESDPHIGSVRGWTLRGNIVSANAPTMSGGWGPDIIQTLDVTIENNTISGVRWAAIGLRGQESTGGKIRNNILSHAERALIDGDEHFSHARPQVEYNLAFATAPLAGTNNIHGQDPLFVDAGRRNFRLRTGSPAIAAGWNGSTIGALPYPNVYYVDPRHPAASDELAWGYPAVPLATLAKACEIAEPGETIVLRGGIYRETLKPKCDGLTIRAMKGEKVEISGANLVEGWRREPDGSWWAPMQTAPRQILRDGVLFKEFTYDAASRRISVNNGDPRLHVFETVVREKPINLDGRNEVTIEGVEVSS